MGEPGAEGIVFRTDAARGPKDAGALSRSVDGYEAYWAQWARTWSSRPSSRRAGPPVRELAAEFLARERLCGPRCSTPTRCAGAGDEGAHRGDAAAQGLGRTRGQARVRRDPRHRVRGAVAAARARPRRSAGARARDPRRARAARARRLCERRRRSAALRRVRLDSHGRAPAPTRRRAPDAHDPGRHRCAHAPCARSGFRDAPGASALDEFEETHRRHQAVVRRSTRSSSSPRCSTRSPASARCPRPRPKNGFASGSRHRPDAGALHELTAVSRRSRVMQQLLPAILGWLSEAPDPDLGLLQLRRLCEGYTDRRRSPAVSATPVAAERTCQILGSSRCSASRCTAIPMSSTRSPTTDRPHRVHGGRAVEAALETLDWRTDESGGAPGAAIQAARAPARRRAMSSEAVSWHRSARARTLADACIEARCNRSSPPFRSRDRPRSARRGEMSYASDIDVVFVYDGTTASDFDVAERLATRLVSAIGETTSEGRRFASGRAAPEGAGTARAITRRVSGLLRTLGPDVGVPALTSTRLRATPKSPSVSSISSDRSSTAIRCPTTGAARSGA